MNTSRKNERGFTIVELLVVIVVIGILAAITIVSYSGISQRAQLVALQSDLSNASDVLKLYRAENGAYPAAIDCSTSPAANTICLKSSSGNLLTYQAEVSTSPRSFHLSGSNSASTYVITDVSKLYTPISCPTGYIVVPGNSVYGTDDFCAMKYEAKNVGGVATSQAASTPWVNITQSTALSTASAACTGCHLMTEGEWLTIAQNVSSVASNWSGGSVGSGYIFSGHNDNSPSNILAADTSDSNGYYGTGNFSGDSSVTGFMVGNSQRRTLTLTNGEVIWDFSGNVGEWTSGSVTGGQPGINGGGYSGRDYISLTNQGTIKPNIFPSATGIAGSSSWTYANGIGMINSNSDDTSTKAPVRSGGYGLGFMAGVFMVSYIDPSTTSSNMGFRVAK